MTEEEEARILMAHYGHWVADHATMPGPSRLERADIEKIVARLLELAKELKE